MSVDSGCNAMCSSKPLNVVKVGRLGLVERRGLEQTFIQPTVFGTQTCSIGATGLAPPVKYTMVSRLGQWRTVVRVWVHVYDGV
jgi:hypothetical protein